MKVNIVDLHVGLLMRSLSFLTSLSTVLTV